MTRTLPNRIQLSPLMRYMQQVAIVVAAIFVLGVPTALAQGVSNPSAETPTIYRLNPGSSFQQGCFPPCLCPIRLAGGVRGTFVLTPTGFDGLFNTYAVTDVSWTETLGDEEVRITGSGTYKVGGEVAVQQQLALDLTVGANPVQHFDSGPVSGGSQFPDITVPISLHGQQCFDTVLVVDASPVPAEQIHPYALLTESTFQRGCFPPCRCPLWIQQPISGTFALVDLRQGPLFAEFAVVNVDWLVAASGGLWSSDLPVRGFGTYRVGGEFAAQHQLSLDLTVGEEDQTHFDSWLVGRGGEVPRIDISISVHGGSCFDTLIDIHAVALGDVTGGLPGALVSSSQNGLRPARLAGDVSANREPRSDKGRVGRCMPPAAIEDPRAPLDGGGDAGA